jgi:XTP/dITP diphosphohydrolase
VGVGIILYGDGRKAMIDLLLATRNKNKVKELQALLAEMPVRVISLLDYPDLPDTPETGTTFAENAEIKSKAAAAATGKISLADDSGLAVDALGGKPGVYSNRFAGPDASDLDKCLKIISMMEGISDELRTARFKAAIAITVPDGETVVVEGTCEGRISRWPHGENGFGYDPIFYLTELDATMAEISADHKNAISHRGKALRRAKDVLHTIIAG